MNSKLLNVLNDVENYTEDNSRPSSKSIIGHGSVKNNVKDGPIKIWIANSDSVSGPSAGAQNEYLVSKNSRYAQILLYNYQGSYSAKMVSRLKSLCTELKFFVLYSSAFNNNSGTITKIKAGVAGDEEWSNFNDLAEAKRLLEAIKQKESEEELAIAQAAAARQKMADDLARKAEEAARKAEKEAKEAEEKARAAAKAREALERERQELYERKAYEQEMARQSVELRNNPHLDMAQNDTKFANILAGPATVINGGPGTGKTTTMIQRLKLLIDKDDLEDYRANNEGCRLTDRSIEIASSGNNWIYFSPNQLLKRYLQSNMQYEGLKYTEARTAVWKEFLHNAVMDSYFIAGTDCPFDFPKKRFEDIPLFKSHHYDVITAFIDYFLKQTKEKFLKISQIDTSSYDWKIIGKVITDECAKIESVNSLTDLLRYLIHMETVDEGIVVKRDEKVKKGKELNKEYNDTIQTLTDETLSRVKKDEERYKVLMDYIARTTKDKEEDEDEEDEAGEQQKDFGEAILISNKRVGALLRKLALRQADKKVKLTPSQQELYDIVAEAIPAESLENISSLAFFSARVYPAMRGSLSNILSSVPTRYKSFRKNLPDTLQPYLNEDMHRYVVETGKNRPLLSQEQALLVGFINRVCKDYSKVRRSDFENSSHKYILAYKELCRPVIGIDEATDYSIIDFFGIRSFGHYDVESFTLCGDSMQMMVEDGISDWNILNHPLIFPEIDVHNLTVSYRQSKELMELAGKIYEAETGKQSPYTCASSYTDTPRPLWIESDDEEEKAEWIAARIIECVSKFGFVPTIGICTKDKDTGEKIRRALDDCIDLTNAGIKVKVCSDNDLAEPKTVRIFPIDEVKGMEFEVVFFYDIDDLESETLVNKYLYVGVSRAARYLAVTSNGSSSRIASLLERYFVQNADWR